MGGEDAYRLPAGRGFLTMSGERNMESQGRGGKICGWRSELSLPSSPAAPLMNSIPSLPDFYFSHGLGGSVDLRVPDTQDLLVTLPTHCLTCHRHCTNHLFTRHAIITRSVKTILKFYMPPHSMRKSSLGVTVCNGLD